MRHAGWIILLVICLLLPTFAGAWDWEVDTSYLNPTDYPLINLNIAVWAIYDPGPQEELSWVALESDGTILRLIPQWNESGAIVGWTEDRDHFAGITAPVSTYQIFFGQWNPFYDGPQILFVGPSGGANIWINHGTLENPDWQTSINYITRTLDLLPTYGIGTGNIDGDELPDLIYLHGADMIHAEWNEQDEEWTVQDTLIELDSYIQAMGVRMADVDGDGDSDFIVINNHQSVFLSYELYVNQSVQFVAQFDDPVSLPIWQGSPLPVDLDGDGIVELAFANGYARSVPDSLYQWQDPTTFVAGQIDLLDHAQDGSIRYIYRPAWYQSTGYHWTYRSGEMGEGGFRPTGWTGPILQDDYGTGGTDPRVGSILDDMNGDGVRDLLVITNPGSMTTYRNDGTDEAPEYVADESLFPLNLQNTPWNIQGHDLDGNGYVDYMFFRDSHWMIYMGGAEEDGSRFWDRNDDLAATILGLGQGTRIFGDVDGDGDADLIFTVGSFSQLLMNEQINGEVQFDQVPRALPENVGFYDGTYCFDFDNDGVEDIAQGRKVYLSRIHGDADEGPLPIMIYLAVAPNPFNSMTRVTLALPEREDVRAGLYNMLGRQVANLDQGTLQPGFHHISIDASNYASGVYLFRMEVFGQVHQRRLVLVK